MAAGLNLGKAFNKVTVGIISAGAMLASALPAYAQTPNTLTQTTVTVTKGVETTIPVFLNLGQQQTVSAFQGNIVGDATNMTGLSVVPGDGLAAVNKNLTCGDHSTVPVIPAGTVKCIGVGLNKTQIPTGTQVMKVKFTIPTSSSAQSLTLVINQTFASDPVGTNSATNGSSQTMTVPQPPPAPGPATDITIKAALEKLSSPFRAAVNFIRGAERNHDKVASAAHHKKGRGDEVTVLLSMQGFTPN